MLCAANHFATGPFTIATGHIPSYIKAGAANLEYLLFLPLLGRDINSQRTFDKSEPLSRQLHLQLIDNSTGGGDPAFFQFIAIMMVIN